MPAVHSKFTRIDYTSKFNDLINDYSDGMFDVYDQRNIKRARDNNPRWFFKTQADHLMENHESGINEKMLQEIRDIVNEMNKVDLHKFQIEAMNAMIAGYIVTKFGKSLRRHMNELRKILPWLPEYIANNIIVAVPRRWGKTFMMAIFYTLIALTQSDSVGLIYSVSGRTSVMMLQLIIAMVKKKQPDLPIKRNKERMEISISGNTRLIYSYPGNPEVSAPAVLHFLYCRLKSTLSMQIFSTCHTHTHFAHTPSRQMTRTRTAPDNILATQINQRR